MSNYRILIVGCGSIGQRHARLLSEREDIELYVADPTEENRKSCCAEARVTKAFADYRDALTIGIEGAFICTPNQMHVEMATAALRSGAHVMVEKPVGVTVDEALRLVMERDWSGKDVAVGYTGRFDKLLRRIRSMLNDGRLGQVVYANASVYTYRTLTCAKAPEYRVNTEWTLVGDYTHEIDFLRFLLGDVNEVTAMAATGGRLDYIPTPNVVEMLLKFRSSAIGTVHMDYVRDPEKRSLELVGDKASIEFNMPQGLLRIYERGRDGCEEISEPYIRDDLFREQIINFLGVIDGNDKPVVTLEDGIEAIRVAEAAIESCRSGSFVRVGELTEWA